MNRRLARIQARRQQLLGRAQVEREALAREVDALAPAVRVVDYGIAGIDWIRRHPEPVIVAAVAFVLLKPKRAVSWALRGFSLWQGYRRIASLVESART